MHIVHHSLRSCWPNLVEITEQKCSRSLLFCGHGVLARVLRSLGVIYSNAVAAQGFLSPEANVCVASPLTGNTYPHLDSSVQ